MKQGSLIFAASDQFADLWYLTGFRAGDPFLWFCVDDQSYIYVNVMEKERAIKQCHPGITVISSNELFSFCQRPQQSPRFIPTSETISMLSKRLDVTQWFVPYDFPAGLANELAARGISIKIKNPFCPERQIKSSTEIDFLRHSQRLAESGLNRATAILKESSISNDGWVIWHDAPLTAELLRGEIDAEIARLGGSAFGTIAAPGIQGADPHLAGSGPIHANQTIIMDIFPRCTDTGYYGDLTRTVVKGKASAEVKKVYQTVKDSQQIAFDMLKPGISGKTVHCTVRDYFEKQGFPTILSGTPRGFFHGLGHSVGLEIHESPHLNMSGNAPLKPGHILTVEPGLYYPEWGGVRLENLVAITENGYDDLTTAGYTLEIE